jgi:hypothetical protein
MVRVRLAEVLVPVTPTPESPAAVVRDAEPTLPVSPSAVSDTRLLTFRVAIPTEPVAPVPASGVAADRVAIA